MVPVAVHEAGGFVTSAVVVPIAAVQSDSCSCACYYTWRHIHRAQLHSWCLLLLLLAALRKCACSVA